MNAKLKAIVISSLALPLTAHAAQARPYDGDINNYQSYLKERIEKGDQSGRLTPSERSKLQSFSERIERLEKQSRRGGLSNYERQNLWQQLDNLDRSITRELRDGERAGWNQGWSDGKGRMQKKDWKEAGRFNFSPFDKRLRAINNKIRDGVESGKLDPNEAAYCDSEYYKLRSLLDKWTRLEGFLSNDESRNFDGMIDRLDNSVDDRLENRNTARGASSFRTGSGGWNQTNLAANSGGKPPLWYCSSEGGYYDANKTVPGTVWGTELYRYGGTMSDGRPAPTSSKVKVNQVGQILW